jgi:hypothetical protein
MAERRHLRCTCCGSARTLATFGIDDNDEFQGAPDHETALLVQTLAGPRKISWRAEPLPLPVAHALRACLAGALERLDAEIAEAIEG